MCKIRLLILIFFFHSSAYAGVEGRGNIELSLYAVDQFEKYLSGKKQNMTKGANERHGKGLVFSISEDGMHTGYMYCPQGKGCSVQEAKSQTHCQNNAKKRTGKKIPCYTFAIERKIVWNNLNRTLNKNVDVKEFISSLGPTSGIRISDAKPPSDLDGEQKKQLKSLFDAGIMTKKEYEEALKQIK